MLLFIRPLHAVDFNAIIINIYLFIYFNVSNFILFRFSEWCYNII